MIRSITRPTTHTLLIPLIFFALLTAVTARITIFLPFTVVPITLQTLAVLLSGLVLGSRAGALSQILYLAALLAGLPISSTGIGGPAVFATPTMGYILAFAPAAFVTGYLLEQLHARNWQTLITHIIAGLCGMLVIYAGGVAWLTLLLSNVQSALQQGLLPFIAVDLGKAIVAALVASGGRLLFTPSLHE